MDVPPCDPLLDLWFEAMVLSKTLNCSSDAKPYSSFVGYQGRKIDCRPFLLLDSYTLKSENLSLTLEDKWCHAELGSASCFVQKMRS